MVPLADIPRTEEMPSIGVGVEVLANGWLPRPSSSKKPLAAERIDHLAGVFFFLSAKLTPSPPAATATTWLSSPTGWGTMLHFWRPQLSVASLPVSNPSWPRPSAPQA